MIKKRKDQFRAMLIELTDGSPSKVIDEYTFFAVSDLGAKRAASEEVYLQTNDGVKKMYITAAHQRSPA